MSLTAGTKLGPYETRLATTTPNTATPVLEDISTAVAFGSAQLDFSQNGTVLYRSGRTPGRTVVQWLTADGKTGPLWDEPAFYGFLRVSPDGSRLASVVSEGSSADVWVYDWQRGGKTRLSTGAGVNTYPVWSHDGQHIVFQSAGQLYWTRADGAEPPQPLTKSARVTFPSSFTENGRRLLFFEQIPGVGSLIQSMTVE